MTNRGLAKTFGDLGSGYPSQQSAKGLYGQMIVETANESTERPSACDLNLSLTFLGRVGVVT